MNWPVAARDHKTFCVSCHTALPYALAAPVLSKALGQQQPPAEAQALLENVRKRVELWDQEEPYYTDRAYGPHKTAQSLGTEAVLNALILANADSTAGQLSSDTRAAFAIMWKLQETSGPGRGAWRWLQFNNEPFEAHDSAYYGAALAGIATGIAPENYKASPAIQKNIRLLRDYLNREYASQSIINRVTALWASLKLPGLFTRQRQESIIHDVLNQQRSDGGWSLGALSWSWRSLDAKSLIKLWLRSNSSPLDPKSDGYATGLIAYTLEQADVPCDHSQLNKALGWLDHNQEVAQGFWPGYSLNNHLPPSSDMGRFMTDAATGFAVLALANDKGQTQAEALSSRQLRRMK